MNEEHHPAPHRDQLPPLTASLLLYTGPLAWLLQLCVGVMLTSWPCFPNIDRRTAPLEGYGWTAAAAIAMLILCALAASASAYFAWRKFQAVRGEHEGDQDTLEEVGQGRTRFVALWAVYLGVGFALTTLVTLVAFLMVPRCLG